VLGSRAADLVASRLEPTRDGVPSYRYLRIRNVTQKGLLDGSSVEPASQVHVYQRLERYTSATATIQIRNVPEGIHRVYQTRAAAAGMSVQEYLLAELERNAALRTPAELVAETERRLQAEDPEGALISLRGTTD
jgi:plasmid stability protein